MTTGAWLIGRAVADRASLEPTSWSTLPIVNSTVWAASQEPTSVWRPSVGKALRRDDDPQRCGREPAATGRRWAPRPQRSCRARRLQRHPRRRRRQEAGLPGNGRGSLNPRGTRPRSRRHSVSDPCKARAIRRISQLPSIFIQTPETIDPDRTAPTRRSWLPWPTTSDLQIQSCPRAAPRSRDPQRRRTRPAYRQEGRCS